MQRFFVPPALLADDEPVLPAEAAHHAVKVLRLGPGSEVLLLDGRGGCARVRLLEVGRRQVSARVEERWQERETAFPVRLLQGVPKGDRFELVLQKGTELGVTHFAPVWTVRSVATGEGRGRQGRWERIVSEAARQSRRAVLPQLSPPSPLREALAASGERLRLMLWEEAAVALEQALPGEPPPDAAVLVGPEGGLSAEEAELAREAGFLPVHLGPRILRTETAGLAIVTLLQARYGDWSLPPAGGR